MPLFWGRYAFFWLLSLHLNRLLCHTDPHCMAYFGGIFFANMGGGGGQNYFHCCFIDISGKPDLPEEAPKLPSAQESYRTEKMLSVFI